MVKKDSLVVESVISAAGGIGYHQYRTLLLLTIPLISLTGLWQLPVFFGQKQPHECTENGTIIMLVNDTSCAMKNTYLTEFGLYCDKKNVGPWLQSAANLGGMVGHMFWGFCQDNFGRRKTYIITGLLTFVFAMSITMTNNYVIFIVLRVFFGLCANGMGSYTLPLELVSSDKRWVVGLFIGCGWGLGTFWHLAAVYFLRDWRYAMMLQIIPLAAALFYFGWLPESPRWLIQKGRKEEAIRVLNDIAKTNGRDIHIELAELKDHVYDEPQSKKRFNFLQIFESRVIFTRFVLVSLIHLVGSALWYTIIFSAGGIGGCIFVVYLVFGIIEGPARICLQGFALKYVRRKGIAAGIGVAALFFLVSQLIKTMNPGEQMSQAASSLVLVCGLIAKFLSTFYWPFIETYNSEITPTILRDSVFGLTSTIAGLGGFLVPILKNKYEVGEPLVISAVAVVVSQLIWLLPPSLNQPLPSSIEEAEALQTSNKKSCIVL